MTEMGGKKESGRTQGKELRAKNSFLGGFTNPGGRGTMSFQRKKPNKQRGWRWVGTWLNKRPFIKKAKDE